MVVVSRWGLLASGLGKSKARYKPGTSRRSIKPYTVRRLALPKMSLTGGPPTALLKQFVKMLKEAAGAFRL